MSGEAKWVVETSGSPGYGPPTRTEIAANGYLLDGEGHLTFSLGGEQVAVFAPGWASAVRQPAS